MNTLRLLLAAKSLQSCLTLRDPTDGSPPGSPIPGILQARTLEWIAISFSRSYYLRHTNKSYYLRHTNKGTKGEIALNSLGNKGELQ